VTAASYTTNLSDIFLDGSTTGWTSIGTGGAGLNQETDFYIQGSSCLSKNAWAGAEKGMIYASGADQGGSGTDGAYIMWITHLTPNSLAAIASGGIKFLIGSGTGAYREFYVGGNDTLEFGGWILAAVNEGQTADNTTGSPTAGVESHFGGLWNLPSGGPTKGSPAAVDGIRFGRCDIVVTGGTAPDAAATFDGILTNLETASLRYGLLAQREPGGAFENSGLLQLGSTAGTEVRFIDSDKTVFLRAHDHVTTNFHTWEVQNASSVVTLTNFVVQALNAVSPGRFLVTDNATITLTGCSFIDMGTFTFASNTTATSTFLRCGSIAANGATLSNSVVNSTSVAANASAVVWNTATDPDGFLDDMSFTMGGTATHAIEFGTSSPTSITLRGITFSGYGATDNQNDSTFHIKRTTGTVTLNLVDCTGNFSYRTDGATVNVVTGTVTVQVTAQTTDGTPIENARVLLRAKDGTGPFPYDETVTISNSGTTATVTHTSHGMATNDYVQITGADLEANNGVFQITVTGTNSYTYTMNSTPGSSPTGTIKATFVALYGLTNASGVLSTSRAYGTDQPVEGWSRKSSASPYYSQGVLNGTVSSTTGFTAAAIMALDE
jgi:hypothetical protein